MNHLPIAKINQVIKEYFEKNQSINTAAAKDLMPQFIQAGIFAKDHRNGLPIRNVLRELDRANALHLIPYVGAERKAVNRIGFLTTETSTGAFGNVFLMNFQKCRSI